MPYLDGADFTELLELVTETSVIDVVRVVLHVQVGTSELALHTRAQANNTNNERRHVICRTTQPHSQRPTRTHAHTHASTQEQKRRRHTAHSARELSLFRRSSRSPSRSSFLRTAHGELLALHIVVVDRIHRRKSHIGLLEVDEPKPRFLFSLPFSSCGRWTDVASSNLESASTKHAVHHPCMHARAKQGET